MKRLATVVLFGISLLAACRVEATDPILLYDYVGFDYEDPDPDSTQFGEAGSGYAGVGEVPNLFSPLVPDTANNEYTYYFSGLSLTSSMTFGDFVVLTYDTGNLEVYEDSKVSGTDPVYGSNPPNATAPSTFTDGTLFLSGTLTGFQLVFNTVAGSGSFEAAFEATGGSQIGNIPLNQRNGWTFAGITANSLDVPEGYEHQVDGQVFLDKPVPVENKTWGSIKALYR